MLLYTPLQRLVPVRRPEAGLQGSYACHVGSSRVKSTLNCRLAEASATQPAHEWRSVFLLGPHKLSWSPSTPRQRPLPFPLRLRLTWPMAMPMRRSGMPWGQEKLISKASTPASWHRSISSSHCAGKRRAGRQGLAQETQTERWVVTHMSHVACRARPAAAQEGRLRAAEVKCLQGP